MSQRYLGGIITANPTLPTLSSASGVWTLEQDFQNSASITPQVIGRSVRLRGSASAYLNRTPASASNRTTWTWSGWVKRGDISSTNIVLFSAATTAGTLANRTIIALSDGTYGQQLFVGQDNGGSFTYWRACSQVLRDPSAWYHIVVVVDTTQGTAASRVNIYINGVQVTAFAASNNPAQNLNTFVNNNNPHGLGFDIGANSRYFDGYLAELNFIDGQALTPSSFGAFDSNGIWQPLSYRGTYGTNGFYLNFSDNSAATATTIGKDYSGNGNNWTPNNISVTAGVTYDSMLDSPTNSASASNYCVLNPLSRTTGTVSNGNLQFIGPSTSGGVQINGTAAVTSGKWYWEVTILTAPYTPRGTGTWYNAFGFGLATVFNGTTSPNTTTNNVNYQDSGYYKNFSGAETDTGSAVVLNDVLAVAVDLDANTFTFYKNNSSVATGTIGVAAGTALVPIIISYDGSYGTMAANFGQRPFAYTPPTGFLALNTQNLPAVTINNGAQYMAATTYTGTGSSLAVSNGANNPIATTFQPDFVWVKDRTATNYHVLFNSIVGGTNYLCSNATQAETGAYGNITFNSNGFTESSGGTGIDNVGTNAHNYVGWQWKAGGTAVSNTSGSITSSVSANTTAGFSVVTYTGTGSAATVGHGLGVAPKMVIVKSRSNGGANWNVWHTSLSDGNSYLELNTTVSQQSNVGPWNSTIPTSSVFSIGTSWSPTNGVGSTHVAYCFASVAGYSAFGKYTGNGSADGAFVYCGFRPRYILIKNSGVSEDWYISDTSRDTYNQSNSALFADLASAEVSNSARGIDFLSNGFKLRGTSSANNASANTYIYMAFAENPFNISRAR